MPLNLVQAAIWLGKGAAHAPDAESEEQADLALAEVLSRMTPDQRALADRLMLADGAAR